MLEFDYVVWYRAIGAFILAVTFTFLSLGIGISKIEEILISSGEMTPHQSRWVMPLIMVALLLAAIVANPVVAVTTVGSLSAIIAVINLVRLLKTY